jgi:hypothetical protein
MKVVLSLLAVLFATALSAQDAQEPQDPKALVKAREAYQKEIARVTAPVNQNYLQTLEALKRDFGTKGDTAGMVAVQKEIDEVKEYMVSDFKGTVVGTWKFLRYVWEIRKDGTVFCPTVNSFGNWKIKGDILTVMWGKEDVHTFKVQPDGKSALEKSSLAGGALSEIVRIK